MARCARVYNRWEMRDDIACELNYDLIYNFLDLLDFLVGVIVLCRCDGDLMLY